MSLPGNIGLLARMPTPASSQYGNVDGPASATDNAIVRFNGTTGKLIQNSTVIMTDNGDIAIPSTATAGLQLYNTADQTTNYERLEAAWGGNIAGLGMKTGTTALGRQFSLYAQADNNAANFARVDIKQTAFPLVSFGNYTTSTGTTNYNRTNAGTLVAVSGFTSSAASGTTNVLAITPTYNQASGTAANTDLKITRTQTAVGSGAQFLIQAGTSGSESLFTVSNLGYGTFGGVTPTTTTFLHTAAGTTGVSSLRIPHGSAPTSPVDGDMWTTTAGLFVRINGSTVGPLS